MQAYTSTKWQRLRSGRATVHWSQMKAYLQHSAIGVGRHAELAKDFSAVDAVHVPSILLPQVTLAGGEEFSGQYIFQPLVVI